jgi:hypothetical protein
MTRIPVLERENMNDAQQAILDKMEQKGARIGFGPAIGYAYSAEVWRLHNESSSHLLDCALSPRQVRMVSLMTVHHWNATYPWHAQAKTALNAGLDIAEIESINDGQMPDFADETDVAVYQAARELLASGNLSDSGFEAAKEKLGFVRLVEVVHIIGHFTTTAMMANIVGATPPEDAVTTLKL